MSLLVTLLKPMFIANVFMVDQELLQELFVASSLFLVSCCLRAAVLYSVEKGRFVVEQCSGAVVECRTSTSCGSWVRVLAVMQPEIQKWNPVDPPSQMFHILSRHEEGPKKECSPTLNLGNISNSRLCLKVLPG